MGGILVGMGMGRKKSDWLYFPAFLQYSTVLRKHIVGTTTHAETRAIAMIAIAASASFIPTEQRTSKQQ
jgi:hypothetical protein